MSSTLKVASQTCADAWDEHHLKVGEARRFSCVVDGENVVISISRTEALGDNWRQLKLVFSSSKAVAVVLHRCFDHHEVVKNLNKKWVVFSVQTGDYVWYLTSRRVEN